MLVALNKLYHPFLLRKNTYYVCVNLKPPFPRFIMTLEYTSSAFIPDKYLYNNWDMIYSTKVRMFSVFFLYFINLV